MTRLLDHLATGMCGVSRLIRMNTKSGLSMNPFSIMRMEALSYIADHPQPSMRNVAKFLGITPPSATAIVNGFVKSGLLKRIADSKDRRIIRLKLTSVGRQSVAKAHHQLAHHFKRVFGHLSRQEQQQLLRIFEKLHNHYKS